MTKNRFKLTDLIISRKMFNQDRMVHYKVTKIKKSSLLVDMITEDRVIFWTEIPFEILNDYEYLSVFQDEFPEYYL